MYPPMTMAPDTQNRSVPNRNAMSMKPAIMARRPTRYTGLGRRFASTTMAKMRIDATPRATCTRMPPDAPSPAIGENDTRCCR